MPGVQVFTRSNYGKETTRGTPVAPTRKFYAEGTGVLEHDLGVSNHEGENRGVRTRVARGTSLFEDVRLKLKSAEGIGYDDLPALVQAQLKGGLAFSGAGADRTVTCVPSMTAANLPEAFSWDVGDDTQNWRVQYGMASKIKLSAAINSETDLELELFGQRAIKGAAAAPADNSAVKIPGDLWTIKVAGTLAGLAGASIQTNWLLGWSLELIPGNIWRHYQDGNLYGAQHVETNIEGTLELTVESTALTISELYDKHVSQTLDFVRLKATGPSLGGSNYSAQLDVPVLWQKPSIIDKAESGINVYKVPAKLAYDATSGQSIGITVVQSLTTMP